MCRFPFMVWSLSWSPRLSLPLDQFCEVTSQALGFEFMEDVFATKENWEGYAITQLLTAQTLATKLGLGSVFHPWPDSTLGSKRVRYAFGSGYSEWIDECWNRISAWPCANEERKAA